MAKCPKCGEDVPMPYKSWEMRPPNPKNAVLIKIYSCMCGHKFRTAERVE